MVYPNYDKIATDQEVGLTSDNMLNQYESLIINNIPIKITNDYAINNYEEHYIEKNNIDPTTDNLNQICLRIV